MNLRGRNKVGATFNMSSLADIIFLLLIFFLITSRIVTPYATPVKRPSSDQRKSATPVATITVNDKNQYFVDGEEVPFGGIAAKLSPKLDQEERPVVMLNMDRSLNIQRLVDMYDLASNMRFELLLATEKEK
jgi:biopolymer transport protein ExbD